MSKWVFLVFSLGDLVVHYESRHLDVNQQWCMFWKVWFLIKTKHSSHIPTARTLEINCMEFLSSIISLVLQYELTYFNSDIFLLKN